MSFTCHSTQEQGVPVFSMFGPCSDKQLKRVKFLSQIELYKSSLKAVACEHVK